MKTDNIKVAETQTALVMQFEKDLKQLTVALNRTTKESQIMAFANGLAIGFHNGKAVVMRADRATEISELPKGARFTNGSGEVAVAMSRRLALQQTISKTEHLLDQLINSAL